MFIMLRIDDYATFRRVATPFYYYDIDLFMRTVDKVADLSEKTGIQVHYSVRPIRTAVSTTSSATRGLERTA